MKKTKKSGSSKLLTLLRSFSAEELAGLQRYLIFKQAPAKCIELFDLLLRLDATNLNSSLYSWDSNIIKRELFSENHEASSSLSVYMSKLSQYAKEYLAYRYWVSRGEEVEKYILEELLNKNLPSHFNQLHRKIEHSYLSNQQKDEEYYCSYYEKKMILHKFSLKYVTHKSSQVLKEVIESFYIYTTLIHLKTYCTILAVSRINIIDYDISKIRDLAMQAQLSYSKEYPIIELYQKLLTLLLERDINKYMDIKTTLKEKGRFIENSEKDNIYVILMNYCNWQKTENFKVELLDLYKVRLEEKIIFKDGFLLPRDAKNIVTLMLQAEQYEEAFEFIQKYSPMIETSRRDVMFNYNMGIYYFYTKHFKKALICLLQADFKDKLLVLDLKVVLLKIYYELGDHEAFYPLLHNFNEYLRKYKGISLSKKQMFVNFIFFIKKLFSIAYLGSKISIHLLKNKMEKCLDLHNRKWLMEQTFTVGNKRYKAKNKAKPLKDIPSNT